MLLAVTGVLRAGLEAEFTLEAISTNGYCCLLAEGSLGTPVGGPPSGFSWQLGSSLSSQDIKPNLSSLALQSGMESKNEDVEVMSTDSSSSSSSDSQ